MPPLTALHCNIDSIIPYPNLFSRLNDNKIQVMKKKIRLFATDLDGTMLSSHGYLSDRGKAALRHLKDAGILVVICSGRPLYSISRIIPQELYDYAVCMNGQEIFDNRTGEHIYMPLIDDAGKEKMIAMLKKYDVFLNAPDRNASYTFCDPRHRFYIFAYKAGRRLLAMLKGKHAYPDEIRTDYEIIRTWECPKICFAGFEVILRQIAGELDDRYEKFFVNRNWLEIQMAGISKGNALKTIMTRENIVSEETVSAGDGENDISMFEASGIGIAVSNAMPETKKRADFIIGRYADDAVARWIFENV